MALPAPDRKLLERSSIEYWRCCLELGLGVLDWPTWEATKQLAKDQKSRANELRLLRLGVELALERGETAGAVSLADDALALARKCGIQIARDLATSARALIAAGRLDETRSRLDGALEAAPIAGGRLSIDAAEAFHRLGNRKAALHHARRGYEWAWADGPPYVFWRDLQRMKRLYAELGEPEPVLAPFDVARIGEIPFEKEIRAAIERLNAEKAAREAKAKSLVPPSS